MEKITPSDTTSYSSSQNVSSGTIEMPKNTNTIPVIIIPQEKSIISNHNQVLINPKTKQVQSQIQRSENIKPYTRIIQPEYHFLP